MQKRKANSKSIGFIKPKCTHDIVDFDLSKILAKKLEVTTKALNLTESELLEIALKKYLKKSKKKLILKKKES